jgi:hypothetical protein
MAKILEAAADANRRRNGKIALRGEIELPYETDVSVRAEIACRIAAWFEDRACPIHWVLHTLNDKGEFQPHLVFTATARPVRQDLDGTWTGSPVGHRWHKGEACAIDGPRAMREFRQLVAAAINGACRAAGIELAAAWHPGRLRDAGIDRPARARVPSFALRRVGPAPDGPARSGRLIDAGDYATVRAERSRWTASRARRRLD